MFPSTSASKVCGCLIPILLVTLIFSFTKVSGHGRLMDPPGRSSAWRFGYGTPVNHRDDELFCGGYSHQWNSHNRGRCGICGDPFDAKIRENELPHGKYAKPLKITGKYEEGSEIDVKVELTAAHYGFFEFKICPWATDDKEVTQECLDRHVITIVGSKSDMQCGLIHEGPHTGADADKYRITDYTARTYNIRLRLPKGLACRRCVLQWTYTGGIHWGKCPDGTSRHGCGPQETFRSCADISIYFKGTGK